MLPTPLERLVRAFEGCPKPDRFTRCECCDCSEIDEYFLLRNRDDVAAEGPVELENREESIQPAGFLWLMPVIGERVARDLPENRLTALMRYLYEDRLDAMNRDRLVATLEFARWVVAETQDQDEVERWAGDVELLEDRVRDAHGRCGRRLNE